MIERNTYRSTRLITTIHSIISFIIIRFTCTCPVRIRRFAEAIAYLWLVNFSRRDAHLLMMAQLYGIDNLVVAATDLIH